jgi:GNAT superfamily N-acetyltransferase
VAADVLRRRVDATLTHYHLLGQEPRLSPLAIGSVDPERATVWDANQIRAVRAADPDEIDSVLAWAEEVYADLPHRRVAVDGDTPHSFEARLALDGWEVTPVLQHVLSGALSDDRPVPTGVTIRAVDGDDDWAAMVRLTRLDHLEEAVKESRDPWDESLTAAIVGHRRRKTPETQPFLASLDDEDVGMFSAMPGIDGMGLVEDLFVAPEARGRGIAIALIRHCVANARARGAREVGIGSDPGDWPKRLYARLGFRPLFVERLWDLEMPPASRE